MTFIKEHLDQLGDIKIVECNYSQYSSRYDAFKRGDIAPAFNPKMGGGALRDLNIYNIHFVVGLFGRPKTVQYLANVEKALTHQACLSWTMSSLKWYVSGPKTALQKSNQPSKVIKGHWQCLEQQIPFLRFS